MNPATWLRRAPERPPTPAVFVDKRQAANFIIAPGPNWHPCFGFLCLASTGSDAANFCSEVCQETWHEFRQVSS